MAMKWFSQARPKAVAALLIIFGAATASAPDLSEAFFNSSQSVVLFLGDSITHNGGYIEYFQADLLKKYPKMKARFVNAGVSGESLPKLFLRLDSVLQAEKPSLVFSSYGMNDAAYNPLDSERFQNYRDGIARLITTVEKTGAPLVLMTSTPFDSLTAAPLIVDQPPYKFKAFYRKYDSVLKAYGNWLLTLRASGRLVIDLQSPLRDWARAQRRLDPKFAWTEEGVHPTLAGHRVMATAISAALFTPAGIAFHPVTPMLPKASVGGHPAGKYLANGAELFDQQGRGGEGSKVDARAHALRIYQGAP